MVETMLVQLAGRTLTKEGGKGEGGKKNRRALTPWLESRVSARSVSKGRRKAGPLSFGGLRCRLFLSAEGEKALGCS